MSVAALNTRLDLRAAGERQRELETAKRNQQRQQALDTRSVPQSPLVTTTTSIPRAKKLRVRRLVRPKLPLHPVTLGLLSGVVAVTTIAWIAPLQSAKALPPKPAPVLAAVATPSPTPQPSPTPTPKARPVDRLAIPRLGINAPMVTVGLTREGNLDTPSTLWQVGWYKNSPRPGENGTSILVGHAGAPAQIGVLENLNRLKPGDKFTYTYADGRALSFEVKTSAAYANNAATAQFLFRRTAGPSLNLVSCAGTWNPKDQTYSKRWIVTAQLL